MTTQIDQETQAILNHYRMSMTKRKILHLWRKARKEMERQILRNRIRTEEELLPIMAEVYEELKPVLFQSFLEEFSDIPRTDAMMWTWLRGAVEACEVMRRYEEKQEWKEIQDFFMTLACHDLIPVDENGMLI